MENSDYKMRFTGEIAELKKGIDELAKGSLEGITISVSRGTDGLSISGKDGSYSIIYGERSDFFRAITILSGKLRNGISSVNLQENRQFKSCGLMFDCSRNAVLKPEAFKDILRKMACMGLNTAMLYTEDTYELDGYPYFGYMRGRYTKAELKDLDEYASALGIELIPCIQTLGHLRMALRWPFAEKIKDRPDILLADEPETYKFIEAMLKTCRECFSTDKIHIGMDEAHDVGLGKHLDKHGFQNRFDILSRHLSKVTEMARVLSFKPMMWSDMFFRLASKKGDYYDLDAAIPHDLPGKIPENTSLVYWDYYHEDVDFYRTMIENHKKLGSETIFAGGIWTWHGMGLNYAKTFRTTVPALKACRETGISTVIATMWGDDGAEVNIYSALLGMQLYAEHAFYDSVSDKHLRERFEMCTGYDVDAFMALEIDDYPAEWCHSNQALTVSKQVLYQDLLLGLFDKNFENVNLTGHYQNKLNNLKNVEVPSDLKELFDYHKQLLTVLCEKCDMGIRITKAYKNADKVVLQTIVADLRQLYSDVESLHMKFTTLWHKTNKPFGFERIDLRFGGLMMRIKSTEIKLQGHVDGSIDSIEELECERLFYGGDGVKSGKSLVSRQTFDDISVPSAGSGF